MKHKPQIILALDVDSVRKASCFVNKLYPRVRIFKVGLQLFTLAGPEAIETIRKKGAEVFLDLKLFDIPNTVAGAVRQAVRLEVKMLTLHISGGEIMLRAAACAADEESRRLKLKRPFLIGVTRLTSQEAKPQEILKLARLGQECALDGVVCSAREVGLLRKKLGKKFIIVTPGIRPSLAAKNDQKRVATAADAAKAGSDFLVVGRPILEAVDPVLAAQQISEEIWKR